MWTLSIYGTLVDMPGRKRPTAFTLLETVIALFLLSFAALSVLSMTQTGFQAQRRSQEIAKANMVAQSVIADMRIWAEDINNFKSGWAPYNTTFTPPGYPEYQVTARALSTGRPIDSPCAELETQWATETQGNRTMPNAIVPVELVIAWDTGPLNQITVLTYVGEPKRNVVGVVYEISGPSSTSVSVGSNTDYSIRMRDAGGIYFDNIMWQWVPDVRYWIADPAAQRDGRYFEMERLPDPGPPDVRPPTPPDRSPVTCYARYAGQYLDAKPDGVEMP